MAALVVVTSTAANTAFGCVSVLLAAVSPENSGRVLGITQTCGAGVRIASPLAAGFLFSWTLGDHRPWPLNYHFTFYVVAGLSIVAVGLAQLIPASATRPVKSI